MPETNACACRLETGSGSRMGRWFIDMDVHGMHRIFSGDGGLAVLDIRKYARDHRRSQPPVQQRRVLIILCILCIHVQK